MSIFRKANRVDLAILDAMWVARPQTLNVIYDRICAGSSWVSLDAVAAWIAPLEKNGYLSIERGADSSMPEYALTAQGRKFLANTEKSLASQQAVQPEEIVREAFHEEHKPVQVSVCNHREPEVEDAAQALLCVDEDELDDWWDALDVEAKADAFVQWSLGNDGCNSHIYIPPAPRAMTASERLKDQLRQSLDAVGGAN